MALQTIQQEYEQYAAAIFSGCEPSDLQREETRKTFFSGAARVLAIMKTIGTDAVTEEEGIAWLDAATEECARFYYDVILPAAEAARAQITDACPPDPTPPQQPPAAPQ